jgi:hypothetical protein
MANLSTVKTISDLGGVFKFGSGVLGKSAIVVGLLMVVGATAIIRLSNEWVILGVFCVLVAVFILWFWKVLTFSERNPELAVLDGALWKGYKEFQVSSKERTPKTIDQTRVPHPRPKSKKQSPALDDGSSEQETDLL